MDLPVISNDYTLPVTNGKRKWRGLWLCRKTRGRKSILSTWNEVENNLVESIFTRMLQDVKEKIKTFVQMCEFVTGIICNEIKANPSAEF